MPWYVHCYHNSHTNKPQEYGPFTNDVEAQILADDHILKGHDARKFELGSLSHLGARINKFMYRTGIKKISKSDSN